MKRKFVQISASPATDGVNMHYSQSVIALADDGTVWESTYSEDDRNWTVWRQLPELPEAG